MELHGDITTVILFNEHSDNYDDDDMNHEKK